MIGFNILFIPNVLQKPTLIIIISLMNHTMSKWKKKKNHFKLFFQDVHIFNIF
jgi:hypothetical protein